MKLVSLFLGGMAAGWLIAQTPAGAPKARHENVNAFARSARKKDPKSFTHLFASGQFGSVYVATPKEAIATHYHAEHDEAVLVVRGGGTLTLGQESFKVRSGELVFVPKGTPHGFLPEVGDEVLVSFFAPTFDGKDRVFTGR